MRNVLLSAVALVALPIAAANAQMSTPGQANPGFYIGGEGGLNWLLQNNSYNFNTGYAVGGKVGYDFVGPRVELEGIYRNNSGNGVTPFGAGFANVSGQINQIAVLANLLYDFAPGATITPYVGAGAGIAFVDPSLSAGCTMCSTSSPTRASWASLGISTRASASAWTAATTAPLIPVPTPTTTSA